MGREPPLDLGIGLAGEAINRQIQHLIGILGDCRLAATKADTCCRTGYRQRPDQGRPTKVGLGGGFFARALLPGQSWTI